MSDEIYGHVIHAIVAGLSPDEATAAAQRVRGLVESHPLNAEFLNGVADSADRFAADQRNAL